MCSSDTVVHCVALTPLFTGYGVIRLPCRLRLLFPFEGFGAPTCAGRIVQL
jgi:hypothetical protein